MIQRYILIPIRVFTCIKLFLEPLFVFQDVSQQIWATLYDYPSLKSCEGLLQYINDCVQLAWGLANQFPPYTIEYDVRTFRKDLHVRFHKADANSDVIKTYLWPALLDTSTGVCVHKGVVIT